MCKEIMQLHNRNLIHFFFVHLKVSNFYKVSTFYNEFMVHGFATLELRFDTHVMITSFVPNVTVVLVPCYNSPHVTSQDLKERAPRCKHSNEVILSGFKCTHVLYHCILNDTFHKLWPWFTHEEEFKSFNALITN